MLRSWYMTTTTLHQDLAHPAPSGSSLRRFSFLRKRTEICGLKFLRHSAELHFCGPPMRDELKASIVCSALISASIAVFAFHHPVDWTLGPVPLASPARGLQEPLPPARFDQFITSYGPPTFEEQSTNGTLKPPLFTKWLDYEPEHLRVAFVAAESPETGAGKSWVLISFVDSRLTKPVSAEEAAKRLSSRRR